MKNTHAEKLIAAYLSGNTVASEDEELMAWIDENPDSRKFFDKTVEVWDAADKGEYPDFSKGKKKAWNKLESSLFTDSEDVAQPTAKIRPLNALLFSKTFGIAASLALLLAIGWWWQQSPEVFTSQTLASEQTMVELPDGTRVWMNENSLLSYDDLGTERRVIFEGEAYFDVQTDSLKPFTIHSGRAVTTVMGTAFNLRAYPQEDAVEVSVTEGKVALTQGNQKQMENNRIELTSGQTGVFDKEEANVKILAEESVQNKTAWKSKQLNFEGMKFSQVLPVIERYYGIKIILENQSLLDCTLRGNHDNPTLTEMINILSFSNEFETQTNGDTIHLQGGVCFQ